MARILALSSWVAHGHVGLSAAVPALQALGHVVTPLPMTILSNHPGWPHVAGARLPCDQLGAMIEALDRNGWLAGVEAGLTGYMPTPDHVDLAAALIRRLCRSRPVPRVIVDPVLGDLPKGLYVPVSVAEAVRDRLVPLADTLTPNAFELGWLTGEAVGTLEAVQVAAAGLFPSAPAQTVLVTSAPAPEGWIGTLSVSRHAALSWATPRREGVPNGVGDVLSGLIAAGLPAGAALGHLSTLIEASLGAPHLRIVESASDWTRAAPLHPQSLPEI